MATAHVEILPRMLRQIAAGSAVASDRSRSRERTFGNRWSQLTLGPIVETGAGLLAIVGITRFGPAARGSSMGRTKEGLPPEDSTRDDGRLVQESLCEAIPNLRHLILRRTVSASNALKHPPLMQTSGANFGCRLFSTPSASNALAGHQASSNRAPRDTSSTRTREQILSGRRTMTRTVTRRFFEFLEATEVLVLAGRSAEI
jgi:hypothetical protein